MSNNIKRMDPVAVGTFIATDVQASATNPAPRTEDLAAAISEVQIETQTLGASLLVVTVIDPGWKILRTGWLSIDSDGLLDSIQVEFPKSTGLWWQLAMIDYTNDLSQPNLTLTFQDRIVSYLNEKWGPMGVASGTTTRAQFIGQLVAQVGRGDGLTPIKFVCPDINQLQPVQTQALTNLGTTVVLDAVTAQNNADKTNKAPGLGMGAAVTIKGVAPNHEQVNNLNSALSLGQQLGASQTALQALIISGIAESTWQSVANSGGSPYWGVLQGSMSEFAQDDVAGQVQSFLEGGKGFQAGGAITLSQTEADPGVIAYKVEGDLSNFPNVAAATYFYDQWLDEAKAIIKAGGAATGAVPTLSDVSQLTRGTADNPDESSWDCIQRLAQEVNWSAWTNGDTMYYMDGPTIASQKPSVYLSLDVTGTTWTATNPTDGDVALDCVSNFEGTYDNTAFQYQSTHTKKGKVQRQTRIRTPQTPSQVKFNMICGVLDYRAGDVFVFQNSGPTDGRWIVEDATRNCIADNFTQFTLGPPTLPNLEPAATTTGLALSGSAGSPNKLAADSQISSPATGNGVAQAARLALADQQAQNCYVYSESLAAGRNGYDVRSNGGTLFGPAPRTMDCSAFATLCYNAAGLDDPSHLGYATPNLGNTASIIAHCAQIPLGKQQPGDLCFYGPSTSNTLHVTVFVGNGEVISMGAQGDPTILGAAYRPDLLGYFRPDVLPNSSTVATVGPGTSQSVNPPPSIWGPPTAPTLGAPSGGL